MSFPWLTVLLVVPLVGGAVVAFLPRSRPELAKWTALGVSLVTLALSLAVLAQYDLGASGYQLGEQHAWIEPLGVFYSLGLDGIGITLVLMTTILVPIVILAGWNDADGARWSVRTFFALMLALEGLVLGVFMATDVFLFYVLFEAALVPAYFLIGGYGGARRSYAALKFLMFSLAGGLLMLAAVIGMWVISNGQGDPSFLLADMKDLSVGTVEGRWLFMGFFLAFAVKAPMVPLHTWLPDAASAATPGTSVLLVSVLDKLGTFGMIRFCLGLFPEASQWASPVVITLAVISILYGALLAIGQDDMMRLIAFTSVSHFGFIVLGIFALTSQSASGSTFYMFNHGLSTAALFLIAGFLIQRRGSARISDFGGVQKIAPIMAGLFLIAGLASLSLPGLSTFVGEFLVLAGTFTVSTTAAVFATLGIVLAALYILLMYQRTMTGPLREDNRGITDMVPREIIAIAPVIVLLIGFGLFPQVILDVVNPAVSETLDHVQVGDPEPETPSFPTAEGSSK
ncbi:MULTISPECIES: NADH-quinone oxidoreductase subunit M [Mumia]|uniref:NADH-quinone oxidoreductase subunit M n=1 Tax=Mumia TaxID=1546255 RepID=UPI0015F8D391|nr:MULTISPECIES: NADH-quinone oxidoreductase subunit M [unclassified Mumia]QMW65835.1 NADH-quinone oxidoreductase subunit M [Mumia sp. ZJ1417]